MMTLQCNYLSLNEMISLSNPGKSVSNKHKFMGWDGQANSCPTCPQHTRTIDINTTPTSFFLSDVLGFKSNINFQNVSSSVITTLVCLQAAPGVRSRYVHCILYNCTSITRHSQSQSAPHRGLDLRNGPGAWLCWISVMASMKLTARTWVQSEQSSKSTNHVYVNKRLETTRFSVSLVGWLLDCISSTFYSSPYAAATQKWALYPVYSGSTSSFHLVVI